MSETAHDVRAPLATIRESVRLVRDGDLGEVTPEQVACLSAAIDQCNCMDQMVGEMVQLERLRTGIPRVRRQWVTVSDIQTTISRTLRPWALPRDVNVLWDVTVEPTARTFADLSMVRRLIVNLAANAIRETAEGGAVLVRVQEVRGGEAIRWSIVDRGRGISDAEMAEIAQRQISLGGGEGLGLSISRQLSALHFSQLRIESRAGTGTVVSFETAAGGPADIAQCWANWRLQQRDPLQKPIERNEQRRENESTTRNNRRVRVDVPTAVIELTCEGTRPQFEDRISAGIVTLGAATTLEMANSFDVVLQNDSRMFDFVYRVEDRQWVWVFDADVRHAEGRIDTIGDKATRKVPGIRLSWSEPQVIPLDRRRTISRLSDLLVRQSLVTSQVNLSPSDEVRLGKNQIDMSGIAAQRLDIEMERLRNRLSNRATSLQQQATRLRPSF